MADLLPENIEKVIKMLEGSKPATKVACCKVLGITYNSAKVDKIIEDYLTEKKHEKDQKAKNRGKAASSGEVIYAIQEYLEGNTVDNIAKGMFRGTSFVKNLLVVNGVTLRPISHDYFSPEMIPDAAVRTSFAIGETVYSSRYNVNAEVRSESKHANQGLVYRVWLLGKEQKFAYTPAYELASLQHLRDLGVKI